MAALKNVPASEDAESQALPEAHSSHTRESTVLRSALWDFTSGTALSCSGTDLTQHSITLAYKTPCDSEVTIIITKQAQKSNSFPEPQKLLQASCPQDASFDLKHHFCQRIHGSYRKNYSTATTSPEPHLALTQKLKHQPHPQALHTWSLPHNIWPQQTDGKEAALPPAAKAPTGFSSTLAGLGQITTPSPKQSSETITKANSRL